MPEDRKTNINNLVIVWQGQSWSTIAPDGRVLGRFLNKRDAFEFAKNNRRYVTEDIPVSNYLDKDFIEFADDLDLDPPPEKPKRGRPVPPDGEWDGLPLAYTDEYPARRWLKPALTVIVSGILLLAGGFIIYSVVVGAGTLLANTVSNIQTAVSSISLIGVAVILVGLCVGGLLLFVILPIILQLLSDLLSVSLDGCGCLSIIGLLAILFVLLSLCAALSL
jgi:hypothetical protein